MKKLQKAVIFLFITTSCISFNPLMTMAEWKSDFKGWWYTEGDSWAIGWRLIDNKWYYFLNDGYMAHDITVDGYKLNSNGQWIQNGNDENNLNNNSIISNDNLNLENNTINSGNSNLLDNKDYKVKSETSVDGIVMKLEESSYDIGTKSIKLYITNNTDKILVCNKSTGFSKFEDNKWHILTQFTSYYDKTIVITPKSTEEATIALNSIKGFQKLTPGKYRITKSMDSKIFNLEFELK